MAANTPNSKSTPDKCPVDHTSRKVWLTQRHGTSKQEQEEKCPVDHNSREVWLKKAQQSQVREDVECSSDEVASAPVYKTNVALPEEREISSIPRTGDNFNWIYPSEKQFYEAMLRKNWDPKSEDMKTVIPLHNSVNERVWNYIKIWEQNQGGEACGGIKLTSFKGDSKKLTPRAWFRASILGLEKPFDRHDWTVDRCGKNVDYVIDFYNEDDDKLGPRIYMDVRPKLNSFEGFKLRVLKLLGF